MAIRILHITLAFLIFISTTGLVIQKHYCQNQLQKIALFFSPESCHSSAQKESPCQAHAKTCCSKKKEKEEQKDCCNNKSEYLKKNYEQQFQAIDFTESILEIIHTPIYNNSNIIATSLQIVAYLNYKPPLITRDYPSIFQVFRL